VGKGVSITGSEFFMRYNSSIYVIKEMRLKLLPLEQPTRAGGRLRIKLSPGLGVPSLCIVHQIAKMDKNIAMLGHQNGFWGIFSDKNQTIKCFVKTLDELVERTTRFVATIILIETTPTLILPDYDI
jgi:hypothetical protein